MNYKRKRIRAGISAYTMSKELGVDYEKYLKVEKKLIPLEGEMLNKYQDVLRNAKMIKFNHKQKMHEIHQFIREGKIKDLMVKRGYNGVTLARVMNIAPSEISHVLNGKNNNEERVERVYDFLMNPINANADVEESEIVDTSKVKEIMNEKGIGVKDIAKALDMSVSSVHQYLGKYYATRTDDKINAQKQKIVDFVNDYEVEDNTPEITPTEVDIVERVKNIKLRDGLSINDLSYECGMSPSHIHRLINGQCGTSPSSFKALSKFVEKYEDNELKLIDVEKIGRIIVEHNLLKQDIEEELGISKGYLSKILNGTSKPSKVLAGEINGYFAKYEAPTEEVTPAEEIAVEIPVAVPVEEEAEFEKFEEIVPISLGELETIEIEPKNDELEPEEHYISILQDDYIEVLKENHKLKNELTQARRQIRLYEILIEKIK